MKDMAEIIITVKPDGSVKVHAEGIQGPACSVHTRPYVLALGEQVGEEPLPEMFMNNISTQQQELQQ